MILGREDQALAAYEAAEVALADWKDEVRDARDSVAEQKEAGTPEPAHHPRPLRRRPRHPGPGRPPGRPVAGRAARGRARPATGPGRAPAAEGPRGADQAGDPAARRPGRSAEQRADVQRHHRWSPADARQRPGDVAVRLADAPDLRLLGPARRHRLRRRCGAPLCAGESGTVINKYYDEVYGNRLYLSVGTVNGANLTLVYNHLSSYNVSEGAHVGRGDVVGYVGSTGWSTGCHLHFTVLRNGEPSTR